MAESARAGRLRRTYGITEEEYKAMFEAQGGRCAICPRKPKNVALNVDHDHVTGLIRGLLCWSCNRKVIGRHRGEAGANLLEAGAEYLRHPPAEDVIGVRPVPPKKRKRRRKSG